LSANPASTAAAGRRAADPGWDHLPALDGLRAAAVAAVLLFHAGHLQGGFLGVDLFFALSGFLITSLLLRDADAGGVRLAEFWGRRFRRLMPAVFVLITVCALWVWVFGTPAELDGVRSSGGFALAYVANWHFISEAAGYWASFEQPSMFDHLWSLAIEEQFYLLWPLVVLAVWKLAAPRQRHRVLLAVTLAGVAASFVTMLALYDPGADPTRVYMGTDTRAASILAGAALATAPARRVAAAAVDRLGGRVDHVLAALGVGVVLSWTAVDGAGSVALYRGGLLAHSVASAVIVAALAIVRHGRTSSLLAWHPLVWVGVRSYGLYLWHYPVYVVVSAERTGLDGWPLTVLRIAISTALAATSFHFVENPIRRRARWARGRRALPALGGAVALVAATLLVLPEPRGQIAAFDPGTIAAPAGSTTPSTTRPTSTTAATVTPAASVRSTTAPTSTSSSTTTSTSTSSTTTTTVAPARVAIGSVMWTGDSIAYDLAPGVVAALGQAGLATTTTAFPGMRLVSDDEFGLLARLEAELPAAGVDVVVVQLSVWDAEDESARQRAALDALQALVGSFGAQLVIVSSPPTTDTATDAGLVPLTEHARALAAAQPASTVFLDSTAVWGATFAADLDADGTPERKHDGVHVCPSGAARFGAWLAAELAARYDGVVPASPLDWAGGEWVVDERYDKPVGACAPLG
jgi:peptidoglycan/LPS O-acetylase OafA/YrhL